MARPGRVPVACVRTGFRKGNERLASPASALDQEHLVSADAPPSLGLFYAFREPDWTCVVMMVLLLHAEGCWDIPDGGLCVEVTSAPLWLVNVYGQWGLGLGLPRAW